MSQDIAQDDLEVQSAIRRSADAHAVLNDEEVKWRDKQPYLESKGYMLRSRYRPGWKPSWDLPGNEDVMAFCFEDSISLPARFGVIDATRISDGRLVCIKRVYSNRDEIRILKMFSQQDLARDTSNHCVPLLDNFLDDNDPNISYIVMPFLRLVDDPPFETIGDIVDFVSQLLEGLEYMHEHDVAHRDCAYKNLMMNADALFPEGYHPARTLRHPEQNRRAKKLSRSSGNVRYYYIDFGISSYLGREQGPRLVLGGFGRDSQVPELSFTVPYDPFKVDVFIIGNLFQTLLLNKYSNVEFLRPLSTAMRRQDPQERPSAHVAHHAWRKSREDISRVQLWLRLRPRNESWSEMIAMDIGSFFRHGFRVGKHIFVWVKTSQGEYVVALIAADI